MPAIEFEKETIGHIIHARRNLRVPINQRSYAWKEEHVEDLYRDLNGAISTNAEEYFLGSIIVVNSGNGTEVYDGQQRLATSIILIAAIRDYFYRAGDTKTADSIAGDFLRSVNRKTLEIEPRFQLSAEDNEFFVGRVLLAPDDPLRRAAKAAADKDSHKKIHAAAGTAAAYVETLTKALPIPEQVAVLHEWLDFIEKQARVIWVEVANQETAFRVFETMNDRGLKLSAADLLKNYVYSITGPKQDQVVKNWQAMTATLESLGPKDGDVVDYIRYFWITGHGPTRTTELFDRIKAEVNNQTTVTSWMDQLEVRAQDYAAILSSSHDTWKGHHQEIRAHIETLRFLEVSQIRPVLLAAMGKFSEKEIERLIRAAINWSVRFLIGGVPSGTLEGHYSRNAKKITEGAVKDMDSLTQEMLAIVPNDDRFRAAAATTVVSDAQLARYYLRVLQMEADGVKEPEYVPNSGKPITLEHILPVNPGKGWTHIAPEDFKANYNRLGNQALLPGSVNSKLGNASFETKKPALAASPYSLTSKAAKYAQWSVAEIAARQQLIAELAVKAWPIKVPK